MDADAKECTERFGVRTIARAPPKYNSPSAGMVRHALREVTEKVRTLLTAAPELHGVVTSPKHVALAWRVLFAGLVFLGRCKAGMDSTAYPRASQRKSHPRAIPCSMERESSLHGRHHEEGTAHRQIL